MAHLPASFGKQLSLIPFWSFVHCFHIYIKNGHRKFQDSELKRKKKNRFGEKIQLQSQSKTLFSSFLQNASARPQLHRQDWANCSPAEMKPKTPTGANAEVECWKSYLCAAWKVCVKSTLSKTCYNLVLRLKDLGSALLSVSVTAKAKKNWLIVPDKDISDELQSRFQNILVPQVSKRERQRC